MYHHLGTEREKPKAAPTEATEENIASITMAPVQMRDEVQLPNKEEIPKSTPRMKKKSRGKLADKHFERYRVPSDFV